jgi:hypothetical protein
MFNLGIITLLLNLMSMLMKKVLLILLLCLTIDKGICQEKHTVGFFRSFPVGNFGSSHLDNGGFAKSGWGFFLENNSKPKLFPKWLTFATRFSYQKNKLDAEGMKRKFTEALGYETRIGEADYKPIMLLGGPHLEVSLRPKMHLQLKSGFGVMFTKLDAFRLEVLDKQGNVFVDDVIDTSSNIPFAYLVGAQLRQIITKNLSIGLSADYTSAKGEMGAKLGKIKVKASEFNIATLNTGLSLRVDF